MIAAERWQTLLGAVIGFLALAGVNALSDHATRREANDREARRCEALVNILSTEVAQLVESMNTIAQQLKQPSTGPLGNIFILPAIDEDIRAEIKNMTLLDGTSADAVLRTVYYAHILRSAVLDKKDDFRAGDIFGITDIGKRELYATAASIAARQGNKTLTILANSHHCKRLRHTSVF